MKPRSKYLYILDPGHGGIDPQTRKYTTAPGKMFDHGGGKIFYEGDFNRLVANMLHNELDRHNIDSVFTCIGTADKSLQWRCNKANSIYDSRNGKAIFISLHSNASPQHNARGIEIFTSPGQTKSDKVAEVIAKRLKSKFPGVPFRADKSDGDLDKEAKFTVLTGTKGPAVLIEFLFYDNPADYEMLKDMNVVTKYVNTLVDAVKLIEKSEI